MIERRCNDEIPTMKPLDKDKTEKAETKAEEKSVEAAPIEIGRVHV